MRTLIRALSVLTALAAIAIPIARACSWSYVIWAIQGPGADPLLRVVRDGKVGYIDPAGKMILRTTLTGTGDNFFGEFHEGLLRVQEKEGARYIDRKGKTVFHTKTWLSFDFSEGLAQAAEMTSAKWGFINRSGKFVIPPQFAFTESFYDGLARVSAKGEVNSTGYIDHTGNFVIPPMLSYGTEFQEGRAAVILGGPCQIINGGSCGRPEFRKTRPLGDYDCRWAFIDKSGAPVSDLRFDDARGFSEGLAPAKVGKQWGYVDRDGKWAIEPRFDSAEGFSDGLAVAVERDEAGYIDHSGQFVLRPKAQGLQAFSQGLALVARQVDDRGQVWHYIDKTGKQAIPGEFAIATSFTYGLAHVALPGKNQFGWIDKNGKTVFVEDEIKRR